MNYDSVTNTGKNGRLTRAELREIVLAEALIYGLENDGKSTSLPVVVDIPIHSSADPLNNVYNMHTWVTEALRYYYRHNISIIDREPFNSNVNFVCYNDKKFRIYRNRIEYGPEHKWRLGNSVMRHIWTKAPLVLFFAEAEVPGQSCLDFTMFEFADKAYDIEENMRAISKYINEICGITNYYYPEKAKSRLYFHDADYEMLIQTVKAEALKLKQKLYDGCYIELDTAQKSDIKEGFNYVKKSRKYYRDIARRQVEKNQKPAG